MSCPLQTSKKGASGGTFRAFVPSARASQTCGPRVPLPSERGLPEEDESALLPSLSRGFQPAPAHVVWVTDFVRNRSKEGAMSTAHRFWQQRPVF